MGGVNCFERKIKYENITGEGQGESQCRDTYIISTDDIRYQGVARDLITYYACKMISPTGQLWNVLNQHIFLFFPATTVGPSSSIFGYEYACRWQCWNWSGFHNPIWVQLAHVQITRASRLVRSLGND